jgi:uncharacterized protein YbcI
MDEERDQTAPVRRGELAAAVSSGMVSMLREYTGRGPTKAKAIVDRDSITVVLSDALTQAERTLAASGRSEQVLETRQRMQRIMRDDAISMVEELTGRTVIAFMSDNHIDPDLGIEVFVLEPLLETAA